MLGVHVLNDVPRVVEVGRSRLQEINAAELAIHCFSSSFVDNSSTCIHTTTFHNAAYNPQRTHTFVYSHQFKPARTQVRGLDPGSCRSAAPEDVANTQTASRAVYLVSGDISVGDISVGTSFVHQRSTHTYGLNHRLCNPLKRCRQTRPEKRRSLVCSTSPITFVVCERGNHVIPIPPTPRHALLNGGQVFERQVHQALDEKQAGASGPRPPGRCQSSGKLRRTCPHQAADSNQAEPGKLGRTNL